ncbi:MAG: hypothetical protein HC838_10040 [Spirulinaceae cyanobacterium RM2_2_10]|nr:hypothetical protein [Spirulinaceae cyanobacterium SM2_1_0]NJO20305.1 hypothetical protein [Spirulinaceae cyanobacterium RM2_2_10]
MNRTIIINRLTPSAPLTNLVARWVSDFWHFSIYYGKFVAAPLERRDRC